MTSSLASDPDEVYAIRYVLEPPGFEKINPIHIESVPVLCSYCDLPLAIAAQDLADLAESGSTTAQHPDEHAAIHHAGGSQAHVQQLVRSIRTGCERMVEELKGMLTPEQVAQITQPTAFPDLVAAVDSVRHNRENEDVGIARLAANLDTYRRLSDAATQGFASAGGVLYGTIKFLIETTSSYPPALYFIADALAELALDIRGSGLFEGIIYNEPLKHAQCAATEMYLELLQALRQIVGEYLEQAMHGESLSDQYLNSFRAAAERPLDRIRFLYYQAQETSAERTVLAIKKGQVQIDEKDRILYVMPESLPAVANQYLAQLLPHLARTAFWEEEERRINVGVRLSMGVALWKAQIYGSYLKSPEHHAWHELPGSSMLGVLGAPATGKAILLGMLRNRAREVARGSSAVCWLDFKHGMHSWLANVRLIVWQIFFQRPGMLFRMLQSQEGFINSVGRNAQNLDYLWDLLIRLTRDLDELWIFAESLQDGDATCDNFVSNLRELMVKEAPHTRIKCCISSINPQHLSMMEHQIELTPQNIEKGLANWLRLELATSGIVDEQINAQVRTIVNRIGGGYIWARLLVAIIRNTRGATPLQAVAGIESQEDAVVRMWLIIKKNHDEGEMRILRPLALVMAKRAAFFSAEAARDAVIKASPEFSTAFTLDDVREVLSNHMPGLVVRLSDGAFLMQPDFAVHLLKKMQKEDAEGKSNKKFARWKAD